MPKVYCDSRKRVQGTDTDFVFQLPQTLDLKEGIAHVDTVLCPNTFFSVRQGENDRLYLRETFSGTATHRIATIEPGQYDGATLAAATAVALNAGTTLVDVSPAYTVDFNATTGRLQVLTTSANPNEFVILPRGLLQLDLDAVWNKAPDSPPLVTLETLADANKVCSSMGRNAIVATVVTSPARGDNYDRCIPLSLSLSTC